MALKVAAPLSSAISITGNTEGGSKDLVYFAGSAVELVASV